MNSDQARAWQLKEASKWKCMLGLFGSFLAVPLAVGLSGGDVGPVAMGAVLLIRIAMPVVFIWGCCDLARSKGYHWSMGFLGFFACVGYVVILLLPDNMPRLIAASSVSEESNYKRDPNRI